MQKISLLMQTLKPKDFIQRYDEPPSYENFGNFGQCYRERWSGCGRNFL